MFKFANYLMTGQTRTRPLQFSTAAPAGFRSRRGGICAPFRTGREREREKCRPRECARARAWMSSHLVDCARRWHFFAAAMRISAICEKRRKRILSRQQFRDRRERSLGRFRGEVASPRSFSFSVARCNDYRTTATLQLEIIQTRFYIVSRISCHQQDATDDRRAADRQISEVFVDKRSDTLNSS